MFTLNQYSSSALLIDDMVKHIVTALEQAIEQRGRASIAVSGGSSPIPMFKKLSEQSLPWNKVYITLVDDRWVDTTHADSNENLVMKHLLINKAKLANFIGFKNNAPTPFAGEQYTQDKLREIPVPFDVVILGMGEDGHTASLFPHAENLHHGLDMHSGKLVVGMVPLTAPHERMTLTLPAILNSHHIYLLLNGKSKKQVLEKALQGHDVDEMPIRAVLEQKKADVIGFWAE